MKKRYYFLISLLVFVISVGGYLYYLLELKEYDIADDEVTEITTTGFSIELPDVNSEDASEVADAEIDEELAKNSTENLTTEKETNNPKDNASKNSNSGSKTSDRAETTSKESRKEVLTEEKIVKSYLGTFESLEAQANERLNHLIKRAHNEYKDKKANKESISYPYFYVKYKTAGEELESLADRSFYVIYEALQQDLVKHGHDPEAAAHLVTTYEKAKKARETALFNKVQEYF